MSINKSFKTLESNTIRYMLKFVSEYEDVKSGKHEEFRLVKELFSARKICSQNFHKFYRRYVESGREESSFLPLRRGPKSKYQEMPNCSDNLISKIIEYRRLGYNKYVISASLIPNILSEARNM